MESAFAWLSDLINFLGKLLPRLIIIRSTHAGVKFKYGSRVCKLLSNNGIRRSGIHFYYPLVTEVITYPIKRQTTNLPFQTLMTADRKAISVGGIVTFEVDPNEIDKTLAACWDIDDTIRDISLACIGDVLLGRTMEEICKKPNIIKRHLTKRLREKLKDYGISVIYFALSDFTEAQTIRILGNESPVTFPMQESSE